MQEKKSEKKQNSKVKFMSRNVTEFRHLIDNSKFRQNDLDWVINLRQNNEITKTLSTQSAPPEVFYKKTKTFQRKTEKGQTGNETKIIPNQYDQVFLKSHDPVHHTLQQIEFYSSLRKHNQSSTNIPEFAQKQFNCIPFKDRKQGPKLIKKQFINKTKPITPKEMQSSIDGAHKQNPYTQNILKSKNYGFLQCFAKLKGRSHIGLPSLAWQIGLRNYR